MEFINSAIGAVGDGNVSLLFEILLTTTEIQEIETRYHLLLLLATGSSQREAAAAAGDLPVAILAGGFRAWRDAKLAVETGHVRMADPPTDVWYRPYDFKEDVEAAMRQYLDWEVDLVPQVVRDGDARFSVLKR